MSISRVDRPARSIFNIRPLSGNLIRWFIAVIAAIGSERRRGTPPLDNYLRRDIGLPPIERVEEWWEYR